MTNKSWQPLQEKQKRKNLRNGQSRSTSVPRINEEYITQVSEQIEDRVIKKVSQEFSMPESRILCALFKFDDLLLNSQIRTHSGTVPRTFRNRWKTKERMRTIPRVIRILNQAPSAARLHKTLALPLAQKSAMTLTSMQFLTPVYSPNFVFHRLTF